MSETENFGVVNNNDGDFKELLREVSKTIGPNPLLGQTYSTYSMADMVGCSQSEILELFERPKLFYFDSDFNCYYEIYSDDGSVAEKVYIDTSPDKPNYSVTIARIVENLPEAKFDLECGGYPMRQREAASLYKLLIINKLFPSRYKRDIEEMLKFYDFERWTDKSGEYAFSDYFEKVSAKSLPLERTILMCCNQRLVADKLKKDTSYRGILSAEDAEWLRMLSEEDARITFNYNERYKSCSNVIEKYKVSEALAAARKELLVEKKVTADQQILFSVYKMNQRDVPDALKLIIRDAVTEYVKTIVSRGMIKGVQEENDLIKKYSLRIQKIYLRRVKEIRYKIWANRTPDTDLSVIAPK